MSFPDLSFSEQELDKSINTHFLRVDGVKQKVAFYTLDVIISVGYRVKSVNGTRFRQWANKILKDYLIKGYTINKNITAERYNELKDMVRIMSRTISLQSNVSNDEYSGLLYGPDKEKRIADNTLVALTLMIAESRTEEMSIMVKVVVNLINREN